MDIYDERDYNTFFSFGVGYQLSQKNRLVRVSLKDKKFYVSIPQVHNK